MRAVAQAGVRSGLNIASPYGPLLACDAEYMDAAAINSDRDVCQPLDPYPDRSVSLARHLKRVYGAPQDRPLRLRDRLKEAALSRVVPPDEHVERPQRHVHVVQALEPLDLGARQHTRPYLLPPARSTPAGRPASPAPLASPPLRTIRFSWSPRLQHVRARHRPPEHAPARRPGRVVAQASASWAAQSTASSHLWSAAASVKSSGSTWSVSTIGGVRREVAPGVEVDHQLVERGERAG